MNYNRRTDKQIKSFIVNIQQQLAIVTRLYHPLEALNILSFLTLHSWTISSMFALKKLRCTHSLLLRKDSC